MSFLLMCGLTRGSQMLTSHMFIPLHLLLGQATMSSLMCIGEKRWDLDVVRDIFNKRDVQHVINIPLSNRDIPDKQYWVFDTKGNYTVKSGYKPCVCTISGVSWMGWTNMKLSHCDGWVYSEAKSWWGKKGKG